MPAGRVADGSELAACVLRRMRRSLCCASSIAVAQGVSAPSGGGARLRLAHGPCPGSWPRRARGARRRFAAACRAPCAMRSALRDPGRRVVASYGGALAGVCVWVKGRIDETSDTQGPEVLGTALGGRLRELRTSSMWGAFGIRVAAASVATLGLHVLVIVVLIPPFSSRRNCLPIT